MTLRFLSRYSRGVETFFLSIKRLTMGGNFLCNKFPVCITFSCFGLYLLLTIYSVLYKSGQRVSLVRQNNNIDNNHHHHHHHRHRHHDTACNFPRMSYFSGPPAVYRATTGLLTSLRKRPYPHGFDFFAIYLLVAFHKYPIRANSNQTKVVQGKCISLARM